MVLFKKKWFDWKFLPQKGILKTTKNYSTLLARCDQASWPKFNHKVPMERGYPYLSFDTLWCKISLLFWLHWPLLQPGAKWKMTKKGVMSILSEVPDKIQWTKISLRKTVELILVSTTICYIHSISKHSITFFVPYKRAGTHFSIHPAKRQYTPPSKKVLEKA